ncbi:MAG: CDC48 family AAA ATPase [Candidatus Thorarchaeota archaeon]|nr:MAG: CDC48 family AAA ATPase [Candidatus Thorarchaeota archaeon]
MSSEREPVQLTVAAAYPADHGHGFVRLNSKVRRELQLRSGDHVLIRGQKETVATSWPAQPEDDTLDIVRMDGLIRGNAGVKLNDIVHISSIAVPEAKRVVIAPVDQIRFGEPFVNFAKRQIINKAVTRGDMLSIGTIGTAIRFVVTAVTPGKHARVTEGTSLEVLQKPVSPEEVTAPLVTYEDIGGLGTELQKIREMVELPMKSPELFKRLGITPPKGVLLHGPPGTGKTLIAKAVANESGANFLVINGPEIMSKFYGESEQKLRELFKEAEENAPSILFIDEIDSIAPKRAEVTGEVERRVVAQLLALMDGLAGRGQVIVIGATNRPDDVDEALRRPGRFDREIELRVPDVKGRLEILQIHTRAMPLEEGVDLSKLAAVAHGFVGADLAALAREAAMCTLRRALPHVDPETGDIPMDILSNLYVTQADFDSAMSEISPSALREVLIEKPNVRWDDVGGLAKVKSQLREAVETPLRHPEVFEEMGIRAPKGVLLFGPPGTGKTLLAKAVATESEANFISVRGPEIFNKYVGESEKAVREVFKKARQTAPCVLFFDEVDAILGSRSMQDDTGVSKRIVNQFLAEIDGLQALQGVLVIGATNRADIIDPAVLRPGRFDSVIFVPPPDKDARLEILKVHTRRMPLDDDVSLEKLAEISEGFSGADLEGLSREAAMAAVRKDWKSRPAKMEHFMEALKEVRPSITPEDLKRFAAIAEWVLRRQPDKIDEAPPGYV